MQTASFRHGLLSHGLDWHSTKMNEQQTKKYKKMLILFSILEYNALQQRMSDFLMFDVLIVSGALPVILVMQFKLKKKKAFLHFIVMKNNGFCLKNFEVKFLGLRNLKQTKISASQLANEEISMLANWREFCWQESFIELLYSTTII
ncbi:hypothetical protein BpHYR1_006644 [Brachionus plicatilis]|uniref:Uncharacterized protein n=1 Tax=Brachionus plicatilis TaxID=10195 RepID=A0A3M7P1J1_BRAPC|nr:hypothetical protein BpHYR1_006644 [Brachionus plicatilis]